MKNSDGKIRVALVDDHALLRKGLASLLEEKGFDIVMQADNGEDFTKMCTDKTAPEVLLLDIAMPLMDGYETANWMRTHFPETRVLALSVFDEESAIIKMLQNGARGYVLKDCEPEELVMAIEAVAAKGYYSSDLVSSKLIHSVQGTGDAARTLDLTEKELQFLRLNCSEKTYKEIALEMDLSPRTVDGYRDSVFEKLGIKSRVGLAIYAIKNRLVYV